MGRMCLLRDDLRGPCWCGDRLLLHSPSPLPPLHSPFFSSPFIPSLPPAALEPGVFTIGSFHGGTNYNIICDTVELVGTVRSFNPDIQKMVVTRIHEVCEGICKAFGAHCHVSYNFGYPVTNNKSEACVNVVKKAGEKLVGAERASVSTMTMGAEDFSLFLNERPGCFFFVGAALPGEEKPHHKSVFDFDEKALQISASMFVQIISDLLLPAAAPAAGGAGCA